MADHPAASAAEKVASADPLLGPLTSEQTALIEIVHGAYVLGQGEQWPSGAYVAHEMWKVGLSLDEVASTLPAVRGALGGPEYRAIWTSGRPVSSDAPIMLTMAGHLHVNGGEGLAPEFLTVVGAMAEKYATAELDPFKPQGLEFTREQAQALTRLPDAFLQRLSSTFEHEPPTWGGGLVEPEPWVLRLTANLLPFRGMTDLADYVSRVRSFLDPPRVLAETALLEESALSLIDQIDFLDTAWELAHGERLFVLPDAGSVASLAMGSGSVDSFQSRMSALVQVLKGMKVDESRTHPVAALKRMLAASAEGRLDGAFATLEAVSAVRNGVQHVAARVEAEAGLRQFGLPFPIEDWDFAWSRVRSQTAAALGLVRAEILAARRG